MLPPWPFRCAAEAPKKSGSAKSWMGPTENPVFLQDLQAPRDVSDAQALPGLLLVVHLLRSHHIRPRHLLPWLELALHSRIALIIQHACQRQCLTHETLDQLLHSLKEGRVIVELEVPQRPHGSNNICALARLRYHSRWHKRHNRTGSATPGAAHSPAAPRNSQARTCPEAQCPTSQQSHACNQKTCPDCCLQGR